jgi:hypothetical protein
MISKIRSASATKTRKCRLGRVKREISLQKSDCRINRRKQTAIGKTPDPSLFPMRSSQQSPVRRKLHASRDIRVIGIERYQRILLQVQQENTPRLTTSNGNTPKPTVQEEVAQKRRPRRKTNPRTHGSKKRNAQCARIRIHRTLRLPA